MKSAASASKKKQGKFLLILPLLVIPFLTMGFWALGGGGDIKRDSQKSVAQKGLNLELPTASLKEDKNANKLSFYEKAMREEEKSQEAIKNDPYYKLPGISDTSGIESIIANSPSKFRPGNDHSHLNTSPVHSEKYSDPNEEKIMEKLTQLQNEISRPQQSFDDMENENIQESYDNGTVSPDVERLEKMMHMMKNKDGEDPEMEKLDGMLEKIMDIQHPERVKERIKEKSVVQKKIAFPVSRIDEGANISLLQGPEAQKQTPLPTGNNGFFSARKNFDSTLEQNSIEAVVHETQTLVEGSFIKLRLLNDVFVNGSLFPVGSFLFGIASLRGERLELEVNSIRNANSIYAVDLLVYDLDGLPGIHIPGAITRDVAKQSAENSLQMMDINTLNPSVAAQAVGAGANTLKSLLSKKARLIKVTVKSGYHILLKNADDNQ